MKDRESVCSEALACVKTPWRVFQMQIADLFLIQEVWVEV